MKKLLTLLSLLIYFNTFSQQGVSISSLPTYNGDPSGGWVPIVVNNQTRKEDAGLFGWKGFDSVSVHYGSSVDTFIYYNRRTNIVLSTTYTHAINQVNSDWNSVSGLSQILNKPTSLSAFTNDPAYITLSQLIWGNILSKPTTVAGYGISDAITPSSTSTLTNKSGNISMWTNDAGYITPSSTSTLTNKSGNISQWTNNSNYLTSVPNTAVTPGSYTNLNATIGADGRITSASNGSSGILASAGMGNFDTPNRLSVDGTDSVKSVIPGVGMVIDSISHPRSLVIKPYALPSALLFTPTQLTGCVAWYDASDFATITVNQSGSQSRITQITDKSTSGFNLLQSDTTKSPTFQYNGGANGQAYISIGANNIITAASATIAQPYSMYIVVNLKTFVHQGDLFQMGAATTNGIATYGPDTRGHYSLTGVASFAWQKTDAMNARTGWQLYKVTFNGTASNVEMNAQLKWREFYQSLLNIGSAGATQIQMGTVGGPQFGMEEVIIMNHAMSDLDDRSIKDYLFLKWGLSNNDFISWYGDSHTSGSALANFDSVAAYVVTDTLFKDYYNYGIATTEVYLGANSFQFTSNYMKGGNNGWVVIGYGTNDFCLVTAANWKANMEAIIRKFINYGYARYKIIVTSPPYQPVKTCLAGEVAILTQIASELGITFVDLWTYTQNYPGGCPLLGDNIHATGTCNRVIALYELGFIH